MPQARGRDWQPHIWEGCDLFAWLRLLGHNRWAVDPAHWYVAAVVGPVSFCHSVLRWMQTGLYGSRIAATSIRHDPIFVLGHWRAGTTLLHELLTLDPRHNFPNTLQCLDPNHFLLTEELVKRYLWFLMPDRRPMDNMRAGWNRPQEDEFALCMLGTPSPYLTIAFPNHPPAFREYLDLRKVAARHLRQWKRAFLGYLRQLTFRDPRRLVLKSPPHTARVRVLLEMFPQAKFVHLVRNPYVVFPSTVNLWKKLYTKHGLQTPTFRGLEEFVYENFLTLHRRYQEDRALIPAGQLCELRYEDLVAAPLQQTERVYQELRLDDFEQVRPRLQEYLAANADYETNRYELPEATRAEIAQRWGEFFQHYGYPT